MVFRIAVEGNSRTDLAPLDAVGSYRRPLNYAANGGVITLEVDTRLETAATKTTNDFWSQTLAARSGDGESLGEFGLSSDGVVEAYSFNASTGDTPLFTKAINFNQWYHLTMSLNFGNHTTTYSVDGTPLGTITDASTSETLLREALVTYAYPDTAGNLRANYTARFDNNTVTAVPEPATVSGLLVAAAGVGLKRRSRRAH